MFLSQDISKLNNLYETFTLKYDEYSIEILLNFIIHQFKRNYMTKMEHFSETYSFFVH